MFDRQAQARSARAAARLRQVTDQLEFDRIAAYRHAILKQMALGHYDDTEEFDFDNLLDVLELAEIALDDYALARLRKQEADAGLLGLGALGDKKSRRARRKRWRERRRQRRRDRKARRKVKSWKKRRRLRKKQYKARKKKFWKSYKKAKKERRERRDRKKAGISQSVQQVSAEQAAAASGEETAIAEPGPTPFFRKPIVIFGGLVVVAVGVVAVGKLAGGKKKKKETS